MMLHGIIIMIHAYVKEMHIPFDITPVKCRAFRKWLKSDKGWRQV
jgi:hypothetical protein